MKILLIILCLLKCFNGQSLTTYAANYHFYVGIFMGEDYTQLDDPEPYQDIDHFLCGATVIGNYWAITTAHCTQPFKDSLPNDNIFVKDGEFITSRLRKGHPGHHSIQVIIQHPDFEDGNRENDISLIRVVDEFSRRVRAAAGHGYIYKEGSNITVIGYGMVHDQGSSTGHSFNEIPSIIYNYDICADEFNKTIEWPGLVNKWNFCGIGLIKKSIGSNCHFGIGGPVIQNGFLIGIVSFGESCGTTYPGVFTKIGEFAKWVRKIESSLHEGTGAYFIDIR